MSFLFLLRSSAIFIEEEKDIKNFSCIYFKGWWFVVMCPGYRLDNVIICGDSSRAAAQMIVVALPVSFVESVSHISSVEEPEWVFEIAYFGPFCRDVASRNIKVI